MSNLVEGYYHCNECDSIYESPVIGVSQHTCPNCSNVIATGSDISSDTGAGVDFLLSEDEESQLGSGARVDASNLSDAGGDDQTEERGSKTTQKERVAMQLRVVSISWIVLVVFVVGVVIYFNRSAGEHSDAVKSSGYEAVRQKETEKQVIKLALPECMRTAKAFLKAETASAKAQFVHDGIRLSREMEAYYAKQPHFPSRLMQLRAVHYQSLNIPGVDAIGTICQTDTGERFEAVFIRDGKEWKIEWKSFVRYSESDWSLFTSRPNGNEAEFRLYMRVMNVGEDLADGDILVQFYKPDIFRGHMFDSYASESIRVPIYSIQGKLLSDLLDNADAVGGTDHVGMQISNFDPQYFHRVRVRMKLGMNAKQEPVVDLLRLLANHWYDPAIVADDGLPEKSE
ncbi:MAG: hypothetical protein P8P36_03970 [Akkermansiaceae bacterium]|nr:hypothetical protein [Akkermansiaceae bacterium]